jgi:MHS family proline/betaine transporter-like MFS transporter
LKLVQGFSTGGEYAGATTYVSEFSPDKKRGFLASLLDVGSYLGFALGAGSVALTHVITSHYFGPDAMAAWGWRIPFLLAIPLGAVAIWFRIKIPETPAFEATEEAQETAEATNTSGEQHPAGLHARKNAAQIIKYHWQELLIAIAIVAATNTAGYALTSYMPVYLGSQFGYNEMESAAAVIPSLIFLCLLIPISGWLSDRLGRRQVYFGAVGAAMFLVAIPVALWVGPTPSTLPALFPTAARYGAMGIAYNVSVSLFGGTTPLISQLLIDATGNSYMPAFWIMFFALLAGVGIIGLKMRETANRPLLGSFPSVETPEEAVAVVARQDDDPLIDTNEMPIIVPDEEDEALVGA